MINYDEMSDLAVNKKLAACIGLLVADEDMSAYAYFYREKYPSTVWVAKQEFGEQVDAWEQVNYCLTPADMWPIAFANNISVINIKNTTQWFACSDVEFENICMSPDGNDSGISSMTAKYHFYCTNPLRAAAIVFLMMKDEE